MPILRKSLLHLDCVAIGWNAEQGRKMAEKVEYSCSDPSKEITRWLSQSKRVEGRGKTALDNLALVY